MRFAALPSMLPNGTSFRASLSASAGRISAGGDGLALAGIQFCLTAVRNVTSRDTYRSFTEKDEYLAAPDDGTI